MLNFAADNDYNSMVQSKEHYISLLLQYKMENGEKYGIKRIGIFGSVARGEQKEESDVDVCVELERPDLFYLVHIKEELCELFETPVDIVRLREHMNPILQRNIARDGIYA